MSGQAITQVFINLTPIIYCTFYTVGLLQVQLICDFLKVSIVMHCNVEGYEMFSQTLTPTSNNSTMEESPILNILWCKLTCDADVPNHLVPLIPCADRDTSKQFNY